ncbi:uncharacterized protein LOC119396962 [Rhipicephalus sanguineus]|uniref:uncharacterized protein LOC119396962 n=1 Tax=Rhipicephalus sanguineus TaxID=34632 RepID=UPI0020C5255A|nr:uncharacterized protein LOC119396962 [Rhipicephalus sanguineus]
MSTATTLLGHGHDYCFMPPQSGEPGNILCEEPALQDEDNQYAASKLPSPAAETASPSVEAASPSTPTRRPTPPSQVSPSDAEPGPSGLQFSKEGSSAEQTQQTPKSGKRKRSSVHTPRTKKKLITLHSRSERYRKALGRMRKRNEARRVTQQEALNKLEPDLPKDLFELLKAQIRLGRQVAVCND